MKNFYISVTDWNGSPEKEKDRYTLIGIAVELFGYDSIASTMSGCVVYGYSIEGRNSLRSRCDEFGINVTIE